MQNPLLQQLDSGVSTSVLVVTTAVADCWQQLHSLDSAAHEVLAVTLPVDESSYGIEQVRELQRLAAFNTGPGRQRELCIVDADKLTIPAQHALLKLLEEPPPATRIWLLTQYPQLLLPTIHSRCVVVTMPAFLVPPQDSVQDTASLVPPAATSTNNPIVAFVRQPPSDYSDCVLIAGTFKDRDGASQACQETLIWLSTQYSSSLVHDDLGLMKIARLQRGLLQALDQLASNGNVKLVLEHCLFGLLPVARGQGT